jgi:cobalt-zinc-cadmium efflux system outer membrane protein
MLTASAGRLCSLLGVEQLPTDRITGDLSIDLPQVDLDRLSASIKERHPSVQAARWDVRAADSRLARARASKIPDASIRLAYGQDAAEDESIVEVGVSIPLPLFDRGQGEIYESAHLAEKSRRVGEAALNDLLADLVAAHAHYVSARDEVETLEDSILPDARKAFEQAQTGYRAGETALLELLDAQRTLTQTQLSALRASRDVNVAWALLWQIVGPDIED